MWLDVWAWSSPSLQTRITSLFQVPGYFFSFQPIICFWVEPKCRISSVNEKKFPWRQSLSEGFEKRKEKENCVHNQRGKEKNGCDYKRWSCCHSSWSPRPTEICGFRLKFSLQTFGFFRFWTGVGGKWGCSVRIYIILLLGELHQLCTTSISVGIVFLVGCLLTRKNNVTRSAILPEKKNLLFWF